MNLKAQLLKAHSKANCNLIVKYIGNDKILFAQLIDLFLAGPYRVTQRAAWPVANIVEAHPDSITPHLKKVIAFAANPIASVSAKRNILRLLQFIEIPKKHFGIVADMCFRFLSDKKETIAVQVFAMTVLANVAKHQPSLANELKIIIEDRLPFASAGFRSRATKILRSL